MPRSRRVVKWTAFALGGVVVVGFVVAAGFRVWASQQLDRAVERWTTEIGSLDPGHFQPPRLSDSDNAAVPLFVGADLVQVDEAEVAQLRHLLSVSSEDWTAAGHRLVDELLARNAEGLEQMVRAVERERCSLELDYASLADLEMPPMENLLRADRLVGVAAMRAESRSDSVRWLAVTGRAAACFRHEPVLLSAMLASSFERSLLARAHRVLPRLDVASVVALEGVLDHHRRTATPLSRAMTYEGSQTMAYFEGLDSSTGGLGTLGRLLGLNQIFAAESLDVWASLVEVTDGGELEPLQRRVDEAESPWERVAAMAIPNLYDAIDRDRGTRAAFDVATLALSMRAEGLERGRYPARPVGERVSPYSGGRIIVEHRTDGSVVVASPDDARLWSERRDSDGLEQPPFEWVLPPVDTARGTIGP